uniref:Translocator protein n=1 Tax=Eptatretus burgeri TaxID=7764 RepID=A0A8C4NMJ5_EPTBU
MSKWIPPVCATLLPHIGALQTYAFRHEFKNWYDDLNKPTWCPPKWVFKSAWPIIYTCMGVGSYLIWKELGGFTNEAVVPLGLYATQLALNWSWTPIFFWAHKMGWVMLNLWPPLLLMEHLLLAHGIPWEQKVVPRLRTLRICFVHVLILHIPFIIIVCDSP